MVLSYRITVYRILSQVYDRKEKLYIRSFDNPDGALQWIFDHQEDLNEHDRYWIMELTHVRSEELQDEESFN